MVHGSCVKCLQQGEGFRVERVQGGDGSRVQYLPHGPTCSVDPTPCNLEHFVDRCNQEGCDQEGDYGSRVECQPPEVQAHTPHPTPHTPHGIRVQCFRRD